MSSVNRPRSLRFRLTLFYAGAMVVVLAVYATLIFYFVSHNMSQFLDNQLKSDFDWALDMMHHDPHGEVIPSDYKETGEGDSPWLQVLSPAGELVSASPEALRHPIPDSHKLAAETEEKIVHVAKLNPPWRIMSGKSMFGNRELVVQVARPVTPIQEDLRYFLYLLLLGLPFCIVLSGLGGYVLARRALAPMDRMAEQARLITATRMSDRLPVDNPNDELGRLSTVFNETLSRLQSSFDQMRRFTSDASHELRTPLTAIRSVGEVGLREKRGESEYREIIGSMLEEVDSLSRLVDRLLLLSRAETGDALLTREDVNLTALVDEVVAQLDVLAEEKQQTIVIEGSTTAHWAGDRLVLRQALINLVDNAIKYTQSGGRIVIRIVELGKNKVIDVVDNGPGIPKELRSRVFDRFYRVDKSRSRENGGTGLGLAIAKSAVEVQGGTLSLESSNGVGSVFRITLPVRTSEARGKL
jgi:heavy metal sensor kinase